ncbi:MAG TPA: HD domain-containing protein [Bacillota bacterium]|nr:HD domain-containing protein [Bacillota bacterium]
MLLKEKARAFATEAHKGQIRKISNEPYINHPIQVAQYLERAGFSEELICAGYLHDIVEDTPYNIEDIEKLFGPTVANLVSAHTEDKGKSWKERKQHTIQTVNNSSKEIKYLIVADKLDNLLGIEKGLQQYGASIWEKFNAGFEQQKWYNESIAASMYHGLNEEDIPFYFYEYEDAVKRVFSS